MQGQICVYGLMWVYGWIWVGTMGGCGYMLDLGRGVGIWMVGVGWGEYMGRGGYMDGG